MLAGDEGKREVLAGDQMARNCGINGVPSFALQGHVLFSGAVPADEMADTFHRAWELLKNMAALGHTLSSQSWRDRPGAKAWHPRSQIFEDDREGKL